MQSLTSERYMKLLKYDIIKELSLPMQQEMKEQAITILKLLAGNKNIMKKDIKACFPNDPNMAIEKYIAALKFTRCIVDSTFAQSILYEVTPIGMLMLEILTENSNNTEGEQ